jgi:hypothetical protein
MMNPKKTLQMPNKAKKISPFGRKPMTQPPGPQTEPAQAMANTTNQVPASAPQPVMQNGPGDKEATASKKKVKVFGRRGQ